MKCIFEDCDNEALEGRNYCKLHQKHGGIEGRYSRRSEIKKSLKKQKKRNYK